jgi:colanic acid biosynthesis glycosyl transferase WcaI
MDVLMISHYFPPDWNGVSTRAYNCARGLAIKGCNVTVISAFPHYPNGYHSSHYRNKIVSLEEMDGIRLIRTWIPNLPHSPISKRIAIYLSFMLSCIFAIMYVRKIDVIFAMNPSFFAFFPAYIYKLVYRKNIVRNVDDLWPEVFYDLGIIRSRFFRSILDGIVSITYRLPTMVVPLSHGYVHTLVEKYDIPLSKIVVIEHGVDTHKFYSSRDLIPKANSGWHRNGKIRIVYSGNISTAYDLETIIEAARLLDSQPLHFIFRGTGEHSHKIKSLVKELGVRNVDVDVNILTQERLISFLKTADIFLLPMNPSLSPTADKGLPTKTLEYQALGKPIICISDGEAGRYISETQSGLVISTPDPKKVASMIMRLVDDHKLAQTLGNNGFNHIMNRLTLEMVGKRFMEVISRTNQ